MGEKNKRKFRQLFTLIAIIILIFTIYVLLDRTKKLERRITEQELVIQRLDGLLNSDLENETLITNTTIKSRDDFKESTHAAVENITNTVSNTISSTTTTMENIAETYTNTASINSNDPEYINDQGVKNLDSTYFVTDPANYNPDDTGKQKISSKDRVKQIAQIGFDESAKRIAGEGTENKESEIVSTETVSPNNYFTRLYSEYDRVYTNIKRECFVVTRKNDLGCGVSIYIDSVTGLIIGGSAFGD